MPPLVILIRPQMGENIGAVARAMSNFGLTEIRIVAPRDGWPNQKALEMAAGGKEIIESAKIYENFETATADITITYATTARPRDMIKRVISPSEAVQEIKARTYLKTALVFGPERTGLTNEDITLCNTIITIPTDEKNSSLNIAQSSVIMGYEWMKVGLEKISPNSTLRNINLNPAPKQDFIEISKQIEKYLDEASYFREPAKKKIMWQNIRNMLQRTMWSEQEIRTFRGMIRALWEHK